MISESIMLLIMIGLCAILYQSIQCGNYGILLAICGLFLIIFAYCSINEYYMKNKRNRHKRKNNVKL